MNKTACVEPEVGMFYCKQCNRLIGRSSPELRGFGPFMKCGSGHHVTGVGSGWTSGLLGFFSSWQFLHIAYVVEFVHPLAGKILLAGVPLSGILLVLLGVCSRNRRNNGAMDVNSIYWREQMGWGLGVLLGSPPGLLINAIYKHSPLYLY